ncbi:thioesterase family protein [soil metagenome]
MSLERTVRADYARFEPIETRWSDNDVYGHVNNVVYYAWFDTAVNRMLIAEGLLDIHGTGESIGLVVETGCRYFASTAFPDAITAGIRVGRLGSSSVRYEIGLFRGDEDEAAAVGFFVHVYVDRDTRRPKPLGEAMRGFLKTLT